MFVAGIIMTTVLVTSRSCLRTDILSNNVSRDSAEKLMELSQEKRAELQKQEQSRSERQSGKTEPYSGR